MKISGKNRFSRLLKYLITVAGVKNYVLAQDLQYDVSYISKWTSGQVLPSEKNEKKILMEISRCIIDRCHADGLNKLFCEYQVETQDDLKLAIFDNLEAEYFYVKKIQDKDWTDGNSKTFFYPEMKLATYIEKMQHPVLRRVNALEVIGIFDIFSIGREYQLQIAEAKNKHVPKGKWYKDVHFSMVINIHYPTFNRKTDVIFLIDLLDKNCCIDFHLYESSQAHGKAIFAVKNDYCISGMLTGEDHCLSVTITEDCKNCNIIYQNLQGFCNREKLLFRKTSMREMLIRHEYVHTLLALKQAWIIGHFTEHFLPEDVFDEIVEKLDDGTKGIPDKEQLKNIYRMSQNIIKETPIQIMIYKTAFYNLVVDHEFDFFNCRTRLSTKQVSRCLEYFLDICRNYPSLDIRMISGRFISNIKYNTKQCVFLSDTISYLRLYRDFNNIFIINRLDMASAFRDMFNCYWEDNSGKLITDKKIIMENVSHVLHGVTGT